MTSSKSACWFVWLVGCAFVCVAGQSSVAQEIRFEYQPAPVDNPLKGLVPYAGDHQDRFPHSLEFDYVPLNKLMVGPDQFDWQPLETLLNNISRRGHQAVIRVWMEYPAKMVFLIS